MNSLGKEEERGVASSTAEEFADSVETLSCVCSLLETQLFFLSQEFSIYQFPPQRDDDDEIFMRARWPSSTFWHL